MSKLFTTGDILLPENADMEKWSVIACDQFTSMPEYWDEVNKRVGGSPSTLRLMLPEAYLGIKDSAAETEKINSAMREYLDSGVFRTVENSFIYVEREMTVGGTRRGILGLLDLEGYDYASRSGSPVRCTEGTVESRLPPRVKVREGAALEMPHVVVFVDDPEWTMFKGLEKCDKLYGFDLMDGGGHILGRRVCGEAAEQVEKALDALCEPAYLEDRYHLGGRPPVIMAVGDGNHSLATAKLCWDRIKQNLSPEEREGHPARRSLVELVNIHDETVCFEPIHRVLFDTDTEAFFAEAGKYFAAEIREGQTHSFTLCRAGEEKTVTLSGYTIGGAIATGQQFCESYLNRHGGKIDYIHDDDAAISMSGKPGCCGILFPTIEKDSLFPSIIQSGAFPAKSFSIGPARDKRYYLECRKIK